MYEHKIELPREDGDGTEWVTLQFKPMAEVPIGVLRRNRHDQEAQMWETFEWALGDQIKVFDRLPSSEIEKIMADWQSNDGQGVTAGGILGLAAIIEEHGGALEADLIQLGLRLRDCPTPGFNWRDLLVIIRYSDMDSHLYRAVNPDAAGWTRTNMLLAEQVDVLHWLQWAKTKDGAKNRKQPKRVPRPGVTKPQQRHGKPKAQPLSKIRQMFKPRDDPRRKTKLDNLFR